MIKRIPTRICTSYVQPYKLPHADNDITLVPSCEWRQFKGMLFLDQSCPQIALSIMNTRQSAHAAFSLPCQVYVLLSYVLVRACVTSVPICQTQ